MIGKLRGTVDGLFDDHVVLDVNGVGYVVHCSARTLAGLPRSGEPAVLSIETQVREDAIRLFGFLKDGERDWFRLMQGVQGVGTKVALAILGTLPPGELASALAMGDRAAIARAPGVGPKLAARLVAELKDKVPVFGHVDAGAVALADPDAAAGAPPQARDAISALVNLGYDRARAAGVVAGAMRDLGEAADTGALVRYGLKHLSA